MIHSSVVCEGTREMCYTKYIPSAQGRVCGDDGDESKVGKGTEFL